MPIKNMCLIKLLLAWVVAILSISLSIAQDTAPIYGGYVTWSPNGQYIAIAVDDHVDIIEVATQQIVQTFTGTGSTLTESIWSPDGQRLGFGGSTNFEIWSNLSGTAIQETVLVDSSGYTASAWSPDGRMIALSRGNYVYFWDADNYELIKTYLAEGIGNPWSLDWNRDSDTLIIGGNLIVQILDFETETATLDFLIEPYLVVVKR